MESGVRSNRVRAIILTTQRTGSTFLVECLRSHPQVECADEILNGQPDDPIPPARGPFRYAIKFERIVRSGAWWPPGYMKAYFSRGKAKARVFKAMYNQLARPFTLPYLRDDRDIRVIHLRRGNLLKVHVSTLLMQKRAELQAKEPTAAVWIHVDPERAIASLRRARAQFDRFESVFENHPRLQVTYESLFDGGNLRLDTGDRICDFLGVYRQPMSSRFMKLNPERLEDMVTNYEELAAAISRSEFADMLA